MIILLLLSLISTTSNCISLHTTIPSVVSHHAIVNKVFNSHETAIKASHHDALVKIFEMFHNAPLKTVIPALEEVVTLLSLQGLKHTSSQLRDKLATTIITIQKEHIAQYSAALYKSLPLYEKVCLWFSQKSISLATFFIRLIKKSYESPIEKLAHQLEWYTFFERVHVLTDYDSAIHFFSQQRTTAYPPCFAFWKEEHTKVKVLVLLKQLDTKITPQMEALMTGGEEAADTIIAATMGDAESAALQATKAESSLITQAFGENSFDFSDTVVDAQATVVEAEAPAASEVIEQTEEVITNANAQDSALLEDAAGGESSAVAPKGKEYYAQQKASLNQKISDLEGQIKQTEQEMNSVANDITASSKNIDQAAKDLKISEAKLKNLQAADPKAKPEDIKAAQDEVASKQSKLTDLNKNHDSLMQKYEGLSRSKFRMSTEISTHQSALKALLAQEAAEEAAETTAQQSKDATQGGENHEGSGENVDAAGTEDGGSLDQDGEEEEYVPKKTSKERIQELEEQHSARMAKLKGIYQDKSKGFFTRAKAYITFGFKKVTTPLRWLDNRMDAYVSSKASNALHKNFGGTLKSIENNPLRQAIKQLPPSWQGIAEMMIQMEVMQATSIVAFWYEQDNEQEYEAWQQKQYNMSQLNNQFTSLMTVQQKQNLNVANQAFLNNLKLISLHKQSEQALSIFSQAWIEQAIFSSPPSSFFTTQSTNIGNNNLPAIDSDYEFELSSMLTPETTFTGSFVPTVPGAWHNIYRTGNWQYLPSNNTFCQLALAPISGSSTTAQANQVLGNTIFRDHVPSQQLIYEVSAICNLYTYQFPFFMGLLFNKGRWVSGIPDRQQQTRFAGLFGAPNKKIYFVCEESKTSSAHEIQQGAPSTQSPFYRILNNPAAYTVQKNLFSPGSLPCAVTINATSYDLVHPTLAATVTATLTPASTPTSSYSITNKNCSMSNGLQHGVGFVSAGCISSFIMKSPQEITYSPQDIALANKNITTIINSAQGGL